jgi:LPXTG-site transpeptidase (sortase) family protein
MTKPTPRNGSRARRWIERILLLAGVAGLGVWCGANLVSRVWQAWANQLFDHETREGAHREKPPTDGSLLGRLTIPRLNLSAMVREGVRENTLSLALGHVPSTALPGQSGNVGVAGHRDALFRDLRGIRKYDLIRFETSSGSYLYQVSSTEIVDPSDVSVLQATRDSELTLVTCYPFYYIGSAPKRFIVKALEVRSGGAPSGAGLRRLRPAAQVAASLKTASDRSTNR